MIKGILHKPVFHILLIAIIGLLAYSNTFHAPFHFDDEFNIVKNPVIKDLQFFIEPSKAKDYTESRGYSAFKNRYIGYLSFALNYRKHGLDVIGYHIFNITVHIINALLFYWLILLTFRTPCFSAGHKLKDPSDGPNAVLIALFSALLFVSHPAQTQAITYIVQRLASLATMFYLLSIVMYIKARLTYRNTEDSIESSEAGPKFKPLLYYLISIISAILAMKTKEIAFTLPVIIVLYEFIFLEGKVMRRILYISPFLLTMLIIPLSLIGTDKPIGELISHVSEATRVQSAISRWDYLFTEFRVIMTYIRLILFPINQNLDYDYPLFHSLFNLEVFLSFMFLLSVFGSGIYLFYRYRHSVTHTRLITFGIFWFFVTLSVESSIIPITDIIFEHRVYLPSIGLFIVISTSVFLFVEKLKDRWKSIDLAVVAALAMVVIVLTGTTYARNIVWKDGVILWEDVVSKSPEKGRGYYNLGLAYKSQGLIDKAIEQYQIAIRLNPYFADAYNNLGVAYQSQGLISEAIKQYHLAIKLSPDADAHNNLGVAYRYQGLIDKAIEQYQIAIRLAPKLPDSYYNLGNIYLSKRFSYQSSRILPDSYKTQPVFCRYI